jgi:hypothetical protein
MSLRIPTPVRRELRRQFKAVLAEREAAAFERGKAEAQAKFDLLLERHARLKELNGHGQLFKADWDESQHKRDHGKFAKIENVGRDAAQGGSEEPSASPPTPTLESHSRSLLSRLKEVPHALVERVSSFVSTKYAGLVDKYGHTGAKAILAATVLLLPVPIPGTSFLPVAIAEAVRRIHGAINGNGKDNEKKAVDDHGLSEDEIQAAAQELLAAILAECGDESGDDSQGHDAIAAAMLEYATEAIEIGEDPTDGLERLREMIKDDGDDDGPPEPDTVTKSILGRIAGLFRKKPKPPAVDATETDSEEIEDTDLEEREPGEKTPEQVAAEVWQLAPDASHVDSFRFLEDPTPAIEVQFKGGGDYTYTFPKSQRDTARVVWEEMSSATHPGIVIWHWLIRGGVPYVRKAFDESLHPRGKNGRFIGKDRIEAAKSDPELANQLRSEVKEGDEGKLDAALSGEYDAGRTKRGQAKHEAGQRRQSKEESKARADELIVKLSDYHAKPGSVTLTAADLHALADHLPGMTVADLRRARMAMRASFGGDRRKAEMVQRLVDHAKGNAGRLEEQQKPVAEPSAIPPVDTRDPASLVRDLLGSDDVSSDPVPIQSPESIRAATVSQAERDLPGIGAMPRSQVLDLGVKLGVTQNADETLHDYRARVAAAHKANREALVQRPEERAAALLTERPSKQAEELAGRVREPLPRDSEGNIIYPKRSEAHKERGRQAAIQREEQFQRLQAAARAREAAKEQPVADPEPSPPLTLGGMQDAATAAKIDRDAELIAELQQHAETPEAKQERIAGYHRGLDRLVLVEGLDDTIAEFFREKIATASEKGQQEAWEEAVAWATRNRNRKPVMKAEPVVVPPVAPVPPPAPIFNITLPAINITLPPMPGNPTGRVRRAKRDEDTGEWVIEDLEPVGHEQGA